jgi:predicted nucleic acid-binding protein
MDIIELIIDANIVIAIILNEPSKEEILRLTAGKIIVSTEILPHEVGNALSAMYKKKRLNAKEVLQAYANFEAMTIRLEKVHVAKALKISCDYGIYAYDAYYLEAARRLRLSLLTLDGSMHKCARAMQIPMEMLNASL